MSSATATEQVVASADRTIESSPERDVETIAAEYREALRASDYAVLKLRNLITYIPHYEQKMKYRIAVRALDVAHLIATAIQEEPAPHLGKDHHAPIRFEDLVNPMYFTIVKSKIIKEHTVKKPRYHDALHERPLPTVKNAPEEVLQDLRTDDEDFEQGVVKQVEETLQQLRDAYQAVLTLANELTTIDRE
jgi:hypothetical protein